MPDLKIEAVPVSLVLITSAVILMIAFLSSRKRLQMLRPDTYAEKVGGNAPELAEGSRVIISPVSTPDQRLRAVVASVNSRMVELVTYAGVGACGTPGAPIRLIVPSEERALEAVVPLIDCRTVSGVAKLFVGKPEWMQTLQRRRNRRLFTDCPATVVSSGPGSLHSAEFAGTLADLSVGGCSLTTNCRLKVGCGYRINLQMEGLQSERIIGVVTDCRSENVLQQMPYRVRCRFVEQSESLRAKLADLTV